MSREELKFKSRSKAQQGRNDRARQITQPRPSERTWRYIARALEAGEDPKDIARRLSLKPYVSDNPLGLGGAGFAWNASHVLRVHEYPHLYDTDQYLIPGPGDLPHEA